MIRVFDVPPIATYTNRLSIPSQSYQTTIDGIAVIPSVASSVVLLRSVLGPGAG